MAAINVRYEVLRLLGSGTSGEVFLALDFLHDGLPVAIKRIPAETMTDEIFREVRNEFYILGGLDHPNIAKVFDISVCGADAPPFRKGDYFVAREYVDGTAASTIDQCPWPLLGELAYQLAWTVDYVHRHGLIHFDIKPDNILISQGIIGGYETRTARLIDFGFAWNPGQKLSGVRGTIDYLAPELIGQSAFDHRADLYSLGTSLYRLAAGRLPFGDLDPIESLKRRQMELPPRLETYRQDIPRDLADMIEWLCQPDPERRPPRAGEAAKVIERHLAQGELFREFYRRIRPHQFVGRTSPLGSASKYLRERAIPVSADYRAEKGFLAVVGPHGIGKTRLLEEVQRELKSEGYIVLRSTCLPGTTRPIAPLIPPLKELAYLGKRSPGSEPGIPLQGESVLEGLLPVLRDPGIDTMSADRLSRRLVEEALWFVQNSHFPRPVILWIDDIDLADSTTVGFCRDLAASTSASRPALIVTAESTEHLHTIMGETRFPATSVIQLSEMDEEEIASFLSRFLDVEAIPSELVHQVIDSVGGNPLVLSELLATFVGSGKTDDLASSLDVVTPSTVQSALLTLYERRFHSLSTDDHRLLEMVSCFQSDVEVEILAQLVTVPGAVLRQTLLRLVNEGMLSAVDRLRTVRFSQSRFQQFVRDQIGIRRRIIHGRIAGMLKEMYAGREDEHAEEIAVQCELAGKRIDAFEFYRRAALVSRRRSDHRGSARMLEKARALAASRADRSAVLDELAEEYRLAADYARAEAALKELLGTRQYPRARRFEILKTLGSIQSLLGEIEASRTSFEMAAAVAASPVERIEIELEFAGLDIVTGRYPAARRRLDALRPRMTDEMRDQKLDLTNKLGVSCFHEAHFDEALQLFLEACDIARSLESPDKLISPLLNLGNAFSAQGEYGEAQKHWETALTLTKKVGNINLEARILNNLGITQYTREHYPEALRNYRRAMELFEQLNNHPGKALCMSNLGEVQFALADYEHALKSWAQTGQMFEELEDHQGISEAAMNTAHVWLMLGDGARARALLAAAWAGMNANGITALSGLYSFLDAMATRAEGSPERALQLCDEARKSFEQSADARNLVSAGLLKGHIQMDLGRIPEAAQTFLDVRSFAGKREFNILEAEANLGLAEIASKETIPGLRHTLEYLKTALANLENSSVVETTWRVAYRLGKAYHQRGLRSKAERHIAFASQAIDQLAQQFQTDDLRRQFLASHDRGLPRSFFGNSN